MLNGEWRKKAFDRLFPGGTHGTGANTPNQQDIEALCGRLRARFEALHRDRDEQRAHRHEGGTETVAALSLDDVKSHLEACQELLADLCCLSSNSQFTSYGYKLDPRENDADAQDVVDLVLLGGLKAIINDEHGPSSTPTPEPGYWGQRRKAHYDRLHALHDATGEPDRPFNSRSLLSESRPWGLGVPR